jgi:membrane protease YdiL (CAAX protease family)
MTAAPELLDGTPRLRLKLLPLLVTIALAIGVPLAGGLMFFGVLMTVVDYAPQLINHVGSHASAAVSPGSFWGWTFFEGIYVGPTEEIPFRALLVTYLVATMPGKLRIGRFEMSWAGVIVAVMFALLHATNFSTRAWALALGQQFYAFALGVLYAYWLEKSRSVLAASIGHNVGDVVEYLIAFAWLGVSHPSSCGPGMRLFQPGLYGSW